MPRRMLQNDILSRCWALGNEEALLAVHSILTHRPQVPRIFVPSSSYFDELMIENCLTTSLEGWNTKTWAILKDTEISPHMLRDMRPKEIADCKEIIEVALKDFSGLGEIHYEMTRFTPFTNEDCSKFIGRFPLDASPVILRSLAMRMASKESYINRHGDCHKLANRVEGPDAYLSVLMEKIEREWQKSWKSELRYSPQASSALNGVDC